MSGRLWEQNRIIRFYVHGWPPHRAMKRLREMYGTGLAETVPEPASVTSSRT